MYTNAFIIKDNDEIPIANMSSNSLVVNPCSSLYNCSNLLKTDETSISPPTKHFITVYAKMHKTVACAIALESLRNKNFMENVLHL